MAEHHVVSRVMQLLDRFCYYSSTLNSQEMSPPPYAIIIDLLQKPYIPS